MRILVADQNAQMLAAIASTFGRHCEIVVATQRDACVAHFEERKFDVIVACEKLRDYTGLELLGEITALSPQTLRVFAARPETLKRLGHRLDFFGLLGTLSYPIDPRKLLLALKVARAKLAAAQPKPPKPKVRHVVLASEWDTGERLGLLERELEAAASVGDDGPSAHGDSAEHSRGDAEVGRGGAPEAQGDTQAAHGGTADRAQGDTRAARGGAPDHARDDTRAGHGGAPDAPQVRVAGHGDRGSHSMAREARTARGADGDASGRAKAGLAAPATSNTAGAAGRLGADASDVRVVDSAAWGVRPSQVAVDDSANARTKSIAAPTSGAEVAKSRIGNAGAKVPHAGDDSAAWKTERSPGVGGNVADASAGSTAWKASARTTAGPRTEEASFEASFDEMPGAIAVAREPKSAAGHRPVGGVAHANEPRAAVEASIEKAPRHDVKTQSAPKGASPASPRSFPKEACNDPDIDAPLPVETHGAANEPLFDNGPGKGGVRSASGEHGTRNASSARSVPGNSAQSNVPQAGEAPGARGAHAPGDESGTPGASNARSTRDATGAVAASSGARAIPDGSSRRAAAGRETDDNDSDTRGAKKTSNTRETSGTRGGAKPAGSSGGAKNGAAKGLTVRKATVPTAAQREAFQRALAKRNAAKRGGGFDDGELALAAEAHDHGARIARPTDRATPFISMQSLSDLAKMAGTKRPLKEFNRGTAQPRRRVIVYGSGVAAALLAVVSFHLLKATPSEHGSNRHVQEANAHLFEPRSTMVEDSTAGPTPQMFAPTPPIGAVPTPAPGLPQPQKFDPNTAPPDPPPPPALEHPGPMEPPSQGSAGNE
jgi:CheY-like chemotaxis protein